MSSRNLSERQPAKNIGALPPARERTMPDGTVRTEKLCPIKLSKKMVDPDGNVVTVPLANGYAIRRIGDYGRMIELAKIKAGFIPFAECPLVRNYIPAAGRRPCKGKFSDEECCVHVKEVIAARRAVKKKKCDDFAARFATKEDVMIKMLENQNKQLNMPASADKTRIGQQGGE